MRHSFLDQYSNLNSLVHRLSPGVKFICTLIYVFSALFCPLKFLVYILVPFIMFCILLSHVPPVIFLKRSLIIIPFVFLVSFSGRWDAVIRGVASFWAVTLFSLTTRFPDVLKALQKMGCPRLIVMIMSFMYRYIFVFSDELMRMKQAKDSRTVKYNRWGEIKISANLIGILFLRAYERAERVYMAMCSRGFNGVIK